jgi:hypothetical protein
VQLSVGHSFNSWVNSVHWRFLDEESQHFDVRQRPIDALKAGKLNEVITAAQASGESFT